MSSAREVFHGWRSQDPMACLLAATRGREMLRGAVRIAANAESHKNSHAVSLSCVNALKAA